MNAMTPQHTLRAADIRVGNSCRSKVKAIHEPAGALLIDEFSQLDHIYFIGTTFRASKFRGDHAAHLTWIQKQGDNISQVGHGSREINMDRAKSDGAASR